jgi:hypothetical protein
MATVAVRPTDQAMHALEQANRVRSVRAQLKREIASGSLSASAVIERCPREAEGMTVRELLQSQPRWGPARCARLMLSVGVSEARSLRLADRIESGVERRAAFLCSAICLRAHESPSVATESADTAAGAVSPDLNREEASEGLVAD